MSRYTQTALDNLAKARKNNPNVSQRRLAHNIFMLHSLDLPVGEWDSNIDQVALDLFRALREPTEIALQHLIRRIDRNALVAADNARTVANRTPRNRRTVGSGRRITT